MLRKYNMATFIFSSGGGSEELGSRDIPLAQYINSIYCWKIPEKYQQFNIRQTQFSRHPGEDM